MFEKILVPLDGSETAEKVIPYVMNITHTYESTVVLLRVIPPFRKSLKASLKIIDQGKAEIENFVGNYMDELTERLRFENIDVESEIVWGSPAMIIIDFAESSGSDLIILGSHGEHASNRWPLGSISTKVIRSRISMPVLIVPTIME